VKKKAWTEHSIKQKEKQEQIEKEFNFLKFNKIDVNVWSEVKNGQTHINIQEKFTLEESRKLLNNLILLLMKVSDENNYSLCPVLKYYRSADVFPTIVGSVFEYGLSERWQIIISVKNSEFLEEVMRELNKETIIYRGKPVNIYSQC
jgi:CTP synthase (UTP-ammonia lyase)